MKTRFVMLLIFVLPPLLRSPLLGQMPKESGSLNVEAQQPGSAVASPVLYSQGNPSDGAQYLLQKLNAARMDPAGEGQRLAAWLTGTPDGQEVVSYYKVDSNQIASAFAALPAVPPLAFNPDLIASSEAHSADLAAHGGVFVNGDAHAGYDGSTPNSRVVASGFRSANGSATGFAGECVAANFASLDSIHAGFLVDWGNPDLGHRQIEMAAGTTNRLNVTGFGVSSLPNGVLIDTGDYGAPGLQPTGTKIVNADVPAMLTGVIYNDANANSQYDPGEGVAGVTVSMVGGYYYAVTTASGGYSLPLVNTDSSNADGLVSVTATLADGSVRTNAVTVTGYPTQYGSYRANVEWEVVTSALSPAANPAKPSISGGGMVAKGSKLKLTVARPASSDLSQPLTVAYTLKGTAVANVDYMPLPSTVTISAGKATAKIKITALNETVLNRPPGAVTLVIKLKGVAGAQGKATVSFAP